MARAPMVRGQLLRTWCMCQLSAFIGNTCLGINIISGEEVRVAIEFESVRAKHPPFEYESKVYKTLAGGVGVPFVRWIREKESEIIVDRDNGVRDGVTVELLAKLKPAFAKDGSTHAGMSLVASAGVTRSDLLDRQRVAGLRQCCRCRPCEPVSRAEVRPSHRQQTRRCDRSRCLPAHHGRRPCVRHPNDRVRLQCHGHRPPRSLARGLVQLLTPQDQPQDCAPSGRPGTQLSLYLPKQQLIGLSDATSLQISHIEYIHSRNLIHRDIEPDNFLMGIGSAATRSTSSLSV